MFIGAHVKTESSYLGTAETAYAMGANTFAFFVRSPQGGAIRPLDTSDTAACDAYLAEHEFGAIVPHAPYIYNLASDNTRTVQRTITSLKHDFERLSYLSHMRYNIHPGAHRGQGTAVGIDLIQKGINEVLKDCPYAYLLLETMAGKGTEVGGTFDELASILSGIEQSGRVGICFDTCHIFDAGYDIRTNYDKVFTEFDSAIGLEKLQAIHLNDSRFGFESKKDRHQELGLGCLGLRTIQRILQDERFSEVPYILETPEKIFSHKEQIKLAQELSKGKDVTDAAEELRAVLSERVDDADAYHVIL